MMNPMTLRNRMLLSFFAVIAVVGTLMGILVQYVVVKDIRGKARSEVRTGLVAAQSEYVGKIAKIKNALVLVSPGDDLARIRDMVNLDYLYFVPAGEVDAVKSEIARWAFHGPRIGGTRLIEADELKAMGGDIYDEVRIPVKPTSMARPSERNMLDQAMAIEYAMRVDSAVWGKEGVLYGGRIINNDFALVDKIRDLAFGNELYDSKPLGTVTIFLDDVRIATNVTDASGERAVGTRVSESVYDAVVQKGGKWLDRAFVVTEWYLTAYEPIRDIDGKVIGVLYVGILEKPFHDMWRNLFIVFTVIIWVSMILAVFLAFFVTLAITNHVKEVVDATDRISRGETGVRVNTDTTIKELDHLAFSFNNMAENLHESQDTLVVSNKKLIELNKNYLDLIGFVSHELKSILASTILNAYSVRDGFLGMVNFKQQKALDSITRNLDYLASTVKNFLNLSKIEKGETTLNVADIALKEDIFDRSVESFHRQAVEKNMTVANNLAAGMKVKADPDLLEIAANNLVSNAIKYGAEGGAVAVNGNWGIATR
jgi:two-component system NtrC family sensor kinase